MRPTQRRRPPNRLLPHRLRPRLSRLCLHQPRRASGQQLGQQPLESSDGGVGVGRARPL